MFQWLFDAIKDLGRWLINALNRIISFFQDVLEWFKVKDLDPKKDTPFIMKADDNMKKMLGQAPTRKVGIFKGVYDKTDETIQYHEVESEQGVDQKTKEVMGGEQLVILS